MVEDYQMIQEKIQNLTDKIKMCRESIKSGLNVENFKTDTLIKEKHRALNLEMTLTDSIDKNSYHLVESRENKAQEEINIPLQQDVSQKQSLFESRDQEVP